MNLNQLNSTGMTSPRTLQRLIDRLVDRGITDDRVLRAMEAVPRHLFVDASLKHLAYEDMSLPIGKRQTISQPFVVARMSQAVLEIPSVSSVLEIGTGSGYQAAVLSQLVASVYSVERIHSLSWQARKQMRQLGIQNVKLKFGDGQEGWDEHAPFDVIMFTAATRQVPTTLMEQLTDHGRIIVPRVSRSGQELVLMQRSDQGWKEEVVQPVVFVPVLTGTEY